ncbi:hypothetical protein Q9L58_004543 [Maublancomyces gigas]|uniref:Uncharacterized protein n=1 Tax=Discina gigas TaxID=1032678 RepID=A0ABR3GKN8_9PEZI
MVTTSSHPLSPLRPFVNRVRDLSVRFPELGELVLMRLPFNMPGPASIISDSAISGSNGHKYHPCIVVGFNEPDPVSYVNSLLPTERDQLLPLIYYPYPHSHYSPPGFGPPLSLENFLSDKPVWLVINPFIVDMGNSPYKPFQPQGILPSTEVDRIKAYKSSVATDSAASEDGLGHRHRTTIVIQSPQDDDDDYDDDDASSGIFPLGDFLLTGPGSLYGTRREAEQRSAIQQWILGL